MTIVSVECPSHSFSSGILPQDVSVGKLREPILVREFREQTEVSTASPIDGRRGLSSS